MEHLAKMWLLQTKTFVIILGLVFLFCPFKTFQQQTLNSITLERLSLLQLRSSLGLRSKDWPIKPDPCSTWKGVECRNNRVFGINISGFKRTRVGAKKPGFFVDGLANFTFLSYFNASNFALLGEIPSWFGEKMKSLEILDLRDCMVKGNIPGNIGKLINLEKLYLSGNKLDGIVPDSLGNLKKLSVLDLGRNRFIGVIPSSFGKLGNLTFLDLSENSFSGTILTTIGTLLKLESLNLSGNGFSSSIPAQLGDLSNLVNLDLSSNTLSGNVPADFRGLRNLRKMVVGRNLLFGSLPVDLFVVLKKLQIIELNNNFFTGDLPNALWVFPELLFLDASHNNFSGQMPNLTLNANLSTAVLNVSSNMLYGSLTTVLRRFNFVNVSDNYFEGDDAGYARGNSSLDGNCLQNKFSQRSGSDCATFYDSMGLKFDNFGLPSAIEPRAKSGDNSHKKWIIVGGVLFIVVLILVVVSIILCTRKKGATNQTGTTGGQRHTGGGQRPHGFAVDLSNMGDAFTYQQILLATDNFNDVNRIKDGHSGVLFQGTLEGGIRVAIKKIDVASVKKDAYKLELDFFSKVSHARLVPLLGYCRENENEKFLVYKYIPNGDLSSALYRKTDSIDDNLKSLDWITRMKIAIGVAEGLSYLHHECNPPLVHRDVKASSILLDNKFEVRLGSLSEVCTQEGDTHQSMISRIWRLPTTSEQGSLGPATATCLYDVYCFGKVLLELVTGKLGISSSDEAKLREWFNSTLPYISMYDKELIQNIVDPSLLIDEDLLEEVWAMAIVARSCLNPKPGRRPLMKYILKALENPLKVVREEPRGSARLRATSSRGSWNAAIFGSWRQSSSDMVTVFGHPGSKGEGTSSFKQSVTSNSQGSGQNGVGDHSSSMRMQSKEVFPEPLEEEHEERDKDV